MILSWIARGPFSGWRGEGDRHTGGRGAPRCCCGVLCTQSGIWVVADQQLVNEETLGSHSSGWWLGPLTTSGLCRKDEVMGAYRKHRGSFIHTDEGGALWRCPHGVDNGYLLKGQLVSLRYWGICIFPSLFSIMTWALECTDQTQRERNTWFVVCVIFRKWGIHWT